MHTTASKIRYQGDRDGKQEIFRYDFERNPKNHYPSAHLHIHGDLPSYVRLPEERKKKTLHHIHFPVIRPTLESVIRLLINDYGIEAKTSSADWGPVLEYTESLFFESFTRQQGSWAGRAQQNSEEGEAH